MKGLVRIIRAKPWLTGGVIALLLALVLAACSTQQPAPSPVTQKQKPSSASEKGTPAQEKQAPAAVAQKQEPKPAVPVSTQELADKQVLVISWPYADLTPVDPARAAEIIAWYLSTETADGLVRYPPGSIDVTKMEPDLAERWEVSKDGLTWTFYLRKGVQFHKGFGEFTAEDVKYSYERFSDPKVKAAYGRPNIQQIDVVDPYTVRIVLKKPDAFFLNDVSNWNGGWIVSKKAVEQMGLEAFSRAPVGTGPFQFGTYVPKESLTLDANKDYFLGKPVLDKIQIKFMGGSDDNVRALALRKGDVQMATSIASTELREALTSEGFNVAGRWGSRHVLHFKLTEKPFDDLRVRQAIAYAIDRTAFEEFYKGSWKPLYAQLTPAQAFSLKKEDIPEELRYEYNPEKARQLLAEAGYPNGFSVKLVVPERSFLEDMLIVQDQLKKVGINFEYQVVDWAKWLATMQQGTNPVEIWSGFEATPDQAFRDYFYSKTIVGKPGAVRNWSHYGEVVGSIDEKLDQAAATTDVEAQKRLYRDIQLQLLRDLPSFPLNYLVEMRTMLAPNVDLGYKFENVLMSDPQISEKTRLLKNK